MLANLGRREDALTATTDAVELYRRRPRPNPPPSTPTSRGAYGVSRGYVPPEAPTTTVRSKPPRSPSPCTGACMPSGPEAFGDDLVGALSTLAGLLDDLERVDEAAEVRKRIEALTARPDNG